VVVLDDIVFDSDVLLMTVEMKAKRVVLMNVIVPNDRVGSIDEEHPTSSRSGTTLRVIEGNLIALQDNAAAARSAQKAVRRVVMDEAIADRHPCSLQLNAGIVVSDLTVLDDPPLSAALPSPGNAELCVVDDLEIAKG
jgi:hypothetical protein